LVIPCKTIDSHAGLKQNPSCGNIDKTKCLQANTTKGWIQIFMSWSSRSWRHVVTWYGINTLKGQAASSVWRWRQHGPLKCWSTILLYSVITQKTMTCISIAVELSSLMWMLRVGEVHILPGTTVLSTNDYNRFGQNLLQNLYT